MSTENELQQSCKHDGNRHSQTFPINPRAMTQRKMEWCVECGKLMDDRTWKVPSVDEANELHQEAERLWNLAGLPIDKQAFLHLAAETLWLKGEVEKVNDFREDLRRKLHEKSDLCAEYQAVAAKLKEQLEQAQAACAVMHHILDRAHWVPWREYDGGYHYEIFGITHDELANSLTTNPGQLLLDRLKQQEEAIQHHTQFCEALTKAFGLAPKLSGSTLLAQLDAKADELKRLLAIPTSPPQST